LFRPYVNNAKVIVDIGCGAGTFSKVIADGKRLIIALDIQVKLLRGIEGPSIEKICADAHYLPFREKSIDCALSISLMEHLEDPERHVKELFTVLKPNGFLVLQLPNLQYIFEPHSKWPLLGFLPKPFQLKVFEGISYGYVNMNVTVKYALNLFKKAGLTLRKAIKVYHLSVMKLLPIAPSYIFILEKTC